MLTSCESDYYMEERNIGKNEVSPKIFLPSSVAKKLSLLYVRQTQFLTN